MEYKESITEEEPMPLSDSNRGFEALAVQTSADVVMEYKESITEEEPMPLSDTHRGFEALAVQTTDVAMENKESITEEEPMPLSDIRRGFEALAVHTAAVVNNEKFWARMYPGLELPGDLKRAVVACVDNFPKLVILNKKSRMMILEQNEELFALRKEFGKDDHWLYIDGEKAFFQDCWEAFNIETQMFFPLPKEPFEYFIYRSVKIGENLLSVFESVVYKSCPINRKWEMVTILPYGFFSSAYILIGDEESKMMMAGGSRAYLYDIPCNKWTRLPDMDTYRKKGAGVFFQGQYFYIGGVGLDDTTVLKSAEIYNLREGKWSTLPDMWQMDLDIHVAVLNDELYGVNLDKCALEKYDATANAWVWECNLPVQSLPIGEGFFSRNVTFLKSCGDKLMYQAAQREEGNEMDVCVRIYMWDPEVRYQWRLIRERKFVASANPDKIF